MSQDEKIADGLRRGVLRLEPVFVQGPAKGWRLVEVSVVPWRGIVQRCTLCDQASELYGRLLHAEWATVDPIRQQRLRRIAQRASYRLHARWSVHRRAANGDLSLVQPNAQHHTIYGYQKRYTVSVTTRVAIIE